MGFTGNYVLNEYTVNMIMEEFKEGMKHKKKYHRYGKYDINELDELALQYEAQKLLNDIRAEIRYAESCIDFGEYGSQYAYWNWYDGVQETIYEYDECIQNNSNITGYHYIILCFLVPVIVLVLAHDSILS